MPKQLQRVLIAGGGTGGHVFPGLALAKALQDEGVDVHWLGASNGIETKLVPAADIPISLLAVTGFRGKKSIAKFASVFNLIKSILRARKVLKQFKPDVVVGMGGFASGPAGIAAWLSRIPLTLHEQNAVSGVTNRILARFAKRVFCGFPGVFQGTKTEFVGNPVRAEIAAIAPPEQRFANRTGAIRILVVGGSLGARALNQNLPEAFSELAKSVAIEIVHQCGKTDADEITQTYQQHGLTAEVKPFIDDIGHYYQWADLIIARAGAMTVAEIAAVGIAAVFVPFPHAVDDHQTKNAGYLVAANAAKILPQSELSVQSVSALLAPLCQSRATLESMAVAARKQRKVDTVLTMIKGIKEIA